MSCTNAYPLTIYYESACPLCDAEMSNLRLRDTAGKLVFVDVSAPDFAGTPKGTTQADLLRLIHGVKADGGLVRGVDVFRLAYRAVGLDWLVAPSDWPVMGALAERVYPWIARNRHRFPRELIRILFETGWRRAAAQAAERHCAVDGACHLH